MKQVYPRYKRSRPLPFPLEDCSFPRSGLSDLATLGQTTVRSRKRKVLSRKRKSGLDLFLSGIYLFPALQNIYSLGEKGKNIIKKICSVLVESTSQSQKCSIAKFHFWEKNFHFWDQIILFRDLTDAKIERSEILAVKIEKKNNLIEEM